MRITSGVGVSVVVSLACCSVAAAATVFPKDLAGFNAAAGNPPIAIDFDSIASGTNLAGMTVAGVTFSSPPGNTLEVVVAADTFTPRGFSGAPNPETNVLPATSGRNVLSPGREALVPGPNLAESDGLTLVFDPPVTAFGFDHLSQSADGFGFTGISVMGVNGPVFSAGVPISSLGGGGAPAAADFWGIVSADNPIVSIVITEGDTNSQFPDCNIGYDTFRFGASTACSGDPDVNGDGDVNGADLGLLLSAWGTDACEGDLNGDGTTDGADLGLLLAAWTG
jgi:hypothetical protein